MSSARGDFFSRLQDELADLRKEVEVIEKKCAQKFLLLNRTSGDVSTDETSSGLDGKCRRVKSFDKLSQTSLDRSFKSRIPRSSSTTDHSSSEDLGSPAPRAFKFKSKGRMTLPRPVTSLGAAGRLADYSTAYPPSSTSSSSFCSRETMSVGSGEFKCCNSPQSTSEAMSAPQIRYQRRPPSQSGSRIASLETTSLRWDHLDTGSVDGSKIPRAPRPTPRCFSALGWSESTGLTTRLTSMRESAAGGDSPCPSFSSIGGISSRLGQEANSTSRLPSPPVSDKKRLRRGSKFREPYAEFNIGCL